MSYALNSLIDILDQILNPEKHHKNWVLDDDDDDKEEIQTLLEKACFVRGFLEKPPPKMSPGELDSLEDEIISKAEEVENALESHITELILSTHDDDDQLVNLSISSLDLGEPFDDVEYQIKECMDAADQATGDDDVSQIPDDDTDNRQPAVSSMRNHQGKLIVGLEQDLSDLENRLRRSSKIEIIPIVGKLGTGKTTLAELIYHKYASSSLPSQFDVCAWATVPKGSNSQNNTESKETKSEKIIHSLLASVSKMAVDKMPQQQCSDLLTALHKELSGRRCLIVLDGIQDFTDWDKVQLAFNGIRPGSRILLTTRKHDVANYVKSQIHQMRPLDDDECWELLRDKVYGEVLCPRELEQIGKRIASNCKGLPLEVQQVGGDLSKVEKRKDLWEEFALSLKSRNLVVGVDKDLEELKGRLFGQNSNLEIIPIVGMGGTGKTVVARLLFDELSASGSDFEVCAWTPISQSYDPRKVLQRLLDCVSEKPVYVQEVSKLIDTLHQILLSRRYLILLDDMWSSEPMEHLRAAFPDNSRGSRIILTTRVQEVADYVHSKSHKMQLLDEKNSWELLRRKVFDNESCPVELEGVGKQIANKCRGLPLAVQVVGGLLSQAERSKSSWDHVADDVSSFIENEDDQFSGIFSWSYFHLPHHLKPCFLYMGSFPEDYEIQASKLIKLWVSDGFLSPMADRSMEAAAEKYLTDLVSRGLVIVRERKENFKVRSYGMHDLLRDLSLKKAHKKKFLYIQDLKTNNLEVDSVCDQRRVSVHSSSSRIEDYDNIPVKLTPLVRSFQSIGLGTKNILSFLCFELALLRQLDLFETEFDEFPEEILKLVNLRYLALCCKCGLPENISVLRNLQTLIFQTLGVGGYFTLGIFDVPQIRHVKLKGSEEDMINPADFGRSFAVQANLQSLSTIPLEILIHLVGKIPNLRKIGIDCSGSSDIVDMGCFGALETFKYTCNLSSQPHSLLVYNFPASITKVTLRQCMVLPPGIGKLPNLQILKLQNCTFEGGEWVPLDDEFRQLRFLLLENLNLVRWCAGSEHYPTLEHLVIRRCLLLEIPSDIGEIPTLQMLQVDECPTSVENSARRITREQLEVFGNSSIRLRINSSSRMDASVEFFLDNLKQLVKHHVQLIQGEDSELHQLQIELGKLKAFLVDASTRYKRDETFKEWEREIRELVYDIEDTIDSSITHLSAAEKSTRRRRFKIFIVKPIITLAEVVSVIRRNKVLPLLSKLDNVKFTPVDLTGTIVAREIRQHKTRFMVGFEEEADEFINFFNNDSTKLEIISIVGMAGQGKTTLARKLFEDSRIKYEFPVRIWVNVSDDLNMRNVLLTILKNFTTSPQDLTVDELIGKVKDHLMSGKFFIVMDDIWTLDAWNQVQKILPRGNYMGRVLVTTRHKDVATKATTKTAPHFLRFLTSQESWKLLQYEVFGELDVVPDELVSIGKVITSDCGGLPLSIVVIGGILMDKTTRTTSYALKKEWEEVSRSVKPYLVDGGKKKLLSSIISLSYEKLSDEFKNCFLYLGVFPKDADIPVKELIRLWIAEGFIQESSGMKSMEQVALDNLNELINRNLVMVKETKLGGEPKICHIHDSVREICKAEAKYENQNFFQEITKSIDGFQPHQNIEKCLRLCIHSYVLEFLKTQKIPKARSFLCFNQSPINLRPAEMSLVTDGFGLLRVYNAKNIIFPKFPQNARLLHLRYLTLVVDQCTSLPEVITELWNLQTLIVDGSSSTLEIKADIWKLRQLRHLQTKASITLRNDGKGDGGEKLQTLSKLSPDSCTPEIFNKAKNLITLGIQGDLNKIADCKHLGTLDHLSKLKLVNEGTTGSAAENPLRRLPDHQDFPSHIQILVLTSTYLEWNRMEVLSRLGTLEVLKLKENAFRGSSWDAVGGGFYKLKQLHIERATELVSWTATRDPFPTLRFLLLNNCDKLLQVPPALYNTLEMLSMERVSKDAVSTAEAIWEEKKQSFKLDIAPGDKIRSHSYI